ncbi:cytochrome c oxidase assembly protein [Halalkalibacillus sediminis]|uniref:Cytochrome c oxidase assembly protein n=1 Tax=Halalkalibacillus sediminis TaxID=2018042 RepID=A0A2I0QR85_9BACI|nr:cytochrome c oxidase assembly protein [Halalkalibacillus sediminis]PKR76844.1 cytochrome c oxidase assembly protein [Halalkalibacillus sediminis]
MEHFNSIGTLSEILLAIPFVVVAAVYFGSLKLSKYRERQWPFYRSVLMMVGLLSALLAVVGPIPQQAHMDFEMHMLGHLLLGMLAPLMIVLSAPMILILRALSVKKAKKVTRLLNSAPAHFFTDPLVATLLNVGGLWVLYTTNLYAMMHDSILLYLFVHLHVFLAGYLFTISMIYIDPMPHRRSYFYRSVVLILALAGHGILSKYIYTNPPIGVGVQEARSGGMLMYYGGDAIDIFIIIILCYQWYKSTAPRRQIA